MIKEQLKKRINAEVKVLAAIDTGKDELNAGVWRKVLRIIAGRISASGIDYNGLHSLLLDYSEELTKQALAKPKRPKRKSRAR